MVRVAVWNLTGEQPGRTPYNKWAFQHVREIVPSADIPNVPGDVWRLESQPRDFSSFRFEHGGKAYSLDQFLDKTDTDGLVILHRGKVILERYGNGMTTDTPHILMSVSKSLTAVVAGTLTEQGKLDPERAVVSMIPELKGSVYSDATVRHVLDMRVGLEFDEDYLATSGADRRVPQVHQLEPFGTGFGHTLLV